MHVENMTILQETVPTLEGKRLGVATTHVKYGRATFTEVFPYTVQMKIAKVL